METTLQQLVLVIVAGSGLLVLGLAVVSRWVHLRGERRSLKRRVICRLCLHAFESFSDTDVVDCPVCHARNDRRTGS